MSNRLTFSLASLTLIFALAFVAMPVMGAAGGPTVTITEYSGKNDYTTTATEPDHVQERIDFRLKVEFSIPVSGWDDTDITISGAADLTSPLTAYASGVTVVPATSAHAGGAADVGKVYYVVINIETSDSAYAHSVISASIAADMVDGNIPTNQLGNQAKTQNFTSLPGATAYNIAASIDPDDKAMITDGKIDTGDTFNVLFTYSGGTGPFPTSIPEAQIQIKDKDGKDINNATTGVTPAAGSAASGNVSTAILTAGAAAVATPIQVGVNPNWANNSTFVWIPSAPGAPDPTITTQPTAEIEISSADGLTTMPRAFVIEVTFTPGENSDGDPVDVTPGDDFHTAVIKGTDSGDNAVVFTKIDSQMSKNNYRGVLQYNTLSVPPLTITLARTADANYMDTSDPADDAMGMVGTTPGTTPPPANAPAKPAAPMAATNATNDLIIDVSWVAPADNGSAITGYTVKKYDSAGMLVKTFPETGDPAITTTSYMVGPIPEADRGMSFTFTVAATNANGTSAESDMSDAYMVPAAVVGPPNNPPFFPAGSSIADIVIWKGHAYTTSVLPKASDDEGDTLGDYTITPDLPDGLRLVANDVQDRTITGTATVSSAKTAYKFSVTDSGGETAELSFNITVLDPIAPSAPTAVSAMEEGDLGSAFANLDRTVNSNKVVVNWTAPVDTTKTSHVPAIPFGAPITGYMVFQSDEDGSNPATYPLAGAPAIKKDASTYTTPAALAVGGYNFKVAAVNSVGTGASSMVEAHQSGHVTVANPPGAASDLRASRVPTSPTSATLDWIEPSNNGGLPVQGYFIFKTLDGGPRIQARLGNVITYRWPDLLPGRHVFRVAAFNYDGVGARSNSTEFSVDVPPGPSDNVKPTFGNETVDNITATVGTAITGRTLPAATDPDGDDGDIVYTLSPSPVLIGLNFNASTRFLAGTPSTQQGATTYTYTARDVHGATASLNFTIQVNPAAPVKAPTIDIPHATSSSARIPLGNYTIQPYDFFVLVRDMDGSGIYSRGPASTWGHSADTALPDLDWFFGTRVVRGVKTNGGTIALHGPTGEHAKDLVFSEVMWGTDSSMAIPECSQWIEFYNATPTAINLSGYEIQFHRSQVPASTWNGAIDVVSNVNAHSVFFPPSEFPGQSGRSNVRDTQGAIAAQQDIISMYRHLDEPRIKTFNVANRGERDKGIGGWNASQYPTANIAPIHIATPGAHQIVHVTLAKTTFSQDIIISEIGNSANDDYDWIELHNTTSAAIKLRKWDFTMIVKEGDVGKEKRLFQFPDNDTVWVPANGYLVIARSHPRNDGNDLAAGIDVTKSAIDQLKRGLGEKDLANHPTAYYYVNSGLVLPNDTNRRLYVLRNANDKHGQPTHVVDATGTLSIEVRGDLPSGFTGHVAHARQLWDTATWPFQGAGKRHDNTIDGTGDEDFRAGRVYQRQGKNSGMGEKHLAIRGYTGIGYDRHAAVNAENGGTPGYSKDAVKAKASDLAGKITISEIMLATDELETAGRVPRATRLPQWIEIYNSSLTQSVNLKNWYIEIQNADSDDLPETRNLSETVRLTAADVYLQPNQTVLIVSSSGLASDDFPGQRVINLFTTAAYRNALNLKIRGNPVLSQVGFWVQLRDAENNIVDTIGNLAVSRRTGQGRRDNFDTDWDLTFDAISPVSEAPTIRAGESMLHSADGQRSSLIRVYDNKTAADGLLKASWRSASETNFRNVPSLTFYGNHRDFGTPGYRGGGPLPVSLSKFRPERLESGDVVIRWTTESELNNAGFNILRSETRTGEYKQVNTQLIKGQGTTSERTTYTHIDTSAKPNVVYYYQIQDVSIDGQVQTLQMSRLKGNVSAEGKLTTTWGELKALQ